ncbi:MAG: hypothetical protein ACREV9_13370 [Burkholderiales bacterium]
MKGESDRASLRSSAKPPLFNRGDLFLLGYLPALALAAWVVPESLWHGFSLALARIQAFLLGGIAAQGRHIAVLVGEQASVADAERISTMLTANAHHARLQILRSHRFGHWEPRTKLVGSEHIERALREGKGAILWVAPFVFTDLMTKLTLHRHGFKVAHLTSYEHGFSKTRWGSLILNPIWTSIERRYIAEHVMLAPGKTGVLSDLARRVHENQLVVIYAVAEAGQRTSAAPFFNGMLHLAGGAPVLARRTGAPLLPVFTIRDEEGTFVTTIESPMRAPTDLDTDAAVQHLVARWAVRLEPYVSRAPDQYVCWYLARTIANATD